MALSRREIDERNWQIQAAQSAIRAGNAEQAQDIVNNLIGGSTIGGAQAALQAAINAMPAPAPPYFPPFFPPYFAPPSFSPGYTPPYFPAPAAPAPPFFPAAPPPTPREVWLKDKTYVPPTGVKQADPDTIIIGDEPVGAQVIQELLYEDIGGIELINISRSDIIDGQNVVYNPIKNLDSIRKRYNPGNIIPISSNTDSFFDKFGINIILRTPYLPYFDDDGNLVIEIGEVRDDELIEVQIDTSGTINEVDL